MSGLAISEAPPSSVPIRFFVSALLWGVCAGAWMMFQGGDAWVSRWTPATVALVHIVVLGVLGNAMLGALTQFLPVAAGSPFPSRVASLAHVLLNAGLLVFVPAMTRLSRPAMCIAGGLLAMALVMFAVSAGIAVWRGTGPRWLRVGIGVSLGALAMTASLGAMALLTLAGVTSARLDWLVDVHVAGGLVGWVLTLLVVVGAVTMPMLQGTRAPTPRTVMTWVAMVLLGLVAGAWQRSNGTPDVLAWTSVLAVWLFAGASTWLQWHARHRRNPVLAAFWSTGIVALALAATLLVAPAVARFDRALLVGTLSIGVGLPLIVAGMMLEIFSFLAWIWLRRAVPRGRPIPGVGRLLPEGDKRVVLAAHLVAAVAVPAALLARRGHVEAGALWALPWLGTLVVLLRCWRRAQAGLARTET